MTFRRRVLSAVVAIVAVTDVLTVGLAEAGSLAPRQEAGVADGDELVVAGDLRRSASMLGCN